MISITEVRPLVMRQNLNSSLMTSKDAYSVTDSLLRREVSTPERTCGRAWSERQVDLAKRTMAEDLRWAWPEYKQNWTSLTDIHGERNLLSFLDEQFRGDI